MTICLRYALSKPGGDLKPNVINVALNELLMYEEVATSSNDDNMAISIELAIEYCECFEIFYNRIPDINISYHATNLKEWALDYQKRCFALFDYIRGSLREKENIDPQTWHRIDEKHFNAGYFDNEQIDALRDLNYELGILLTTD